MPELPDVEVFRQYMESTSLNKKIETVDVKDPGMLRKVDKKRLESYLTGKAFNTTKRHGKYFFAQLNNENWLVLHFGMTGFFKYFKEPHEEPDHTRLLIKFANDYYLAYDCQRKLGLIDLIENVDKFVKENELGVDPYANGMDLQQFMNLLKGKRGSVKSALMNQSTIAGIGNIYSDEILFQAAIYPGRGMNELDDDTLHKIFQKMHKVIQTAIKEKVNPKNFPKNYLLGYRKDGDKCPICGGGIVKKKISGRSSYFCQNHQK